MRRFGLYLFALVVSSAALFGSNGGVDHVPVSDPVYPFLERLQTRGVLAGQSLALLPLSRADVLVALESVMEHSSSNTHDIDIATKHIQRLQMPSNRRAVLIHSSSDSTSLFSELLSAEHQLLFYASEDSTHSLRIAPLLSLEQRFENGDSSRNVTLGQAGFRMAGTFDNTIGYLLQVTNGAVLQGNRSLAMDDPRLGRNVKFGDLNSDFDFTESHVSARFDWLTIGIGRESRMWGNGFFDRLYVGTGTAPLDGLEIGVEVDNFSYRYMHASAIGISESQWSFGPEAVIPQKHMVTHRFGVHGDWGEVGFQETIMYSERSFDLAYLNPLSFFKSVEHSLRDRDNSLIGVDVSIRPVDGIQLRGQWILDDLIFDSIGTDYWGNKTAWTLGAMWSSNFGTDVAVEYQRHEPFVFSHFNIQNSVTSDEVPIAGTLQPNSERTTFMLRYWAHDLPIELRVWSTKHGKNIYDGDSLIVNAGGDILQTRRSEDPTGAPFLGGELEEEVGVELSGGYRIFPSLHAKAVLRLYERDGVRFTSGAVTVALHFF